MNPRNGGNPAIDMLAKIAAKAVNGKNRPKPPSLRRSLILVAWIAVPAQKNKAAL